ncbi:hypothetical protein LY78DRAFT_688044 [Colletotrichum sublineola]|nr:hypothetical protein LY78DRAFT_688044 [Colletotrichum sublineola]
MFELPDAKRVRREELDDSSEDEASGHDEQQDAELLAKLHARMAGMLDLSGIDQGPAETAAAAAAAADDDTAMTDGPGRDTQGDDDDNAPEEFEFRLFTTTDPTTKIALVDEDERGLQGDGAMLRGRPLSYYIAGEPTPEARAELAFAAVSGDEVVARARQRWWGMEMPWRVTRIPSASGAAAESGKCVGEEEEEEETAAAAAARRRRPGKKKRVALRVRERERKKKAEEQERAKLGKEEALKEKKKRLNRLKKLRKRAKAKEGKKGDGGAAEGDEGDESGSGSDGGDE